MVCSILVVAFVHVGNYFVDILFIILCVLVCYVCVGVAGSYVAYAVYVGVHVDICG